MGEYKFTVSGRLPGMNEYTAAQRNNRFVGARMKKDASAVVAAHIWQELRGLQIDCPVSLHYVFYERDRRRDHDNVSGFAHKVVQDALVNLHVLKNDGWSEITGYSDKFLVDRRNPRIEITIKEEVTT